jgi:hypothetical protein
VCILHTKRIKLNPRFSDMNLFNSSGHNLLAPTAQKGNNKKNYLRSFLSFTRKLRPKLIRKIYSSHLALPIVRTSSYRHVFTNVFYRGRAAWHDWLKFYHVWKIRKIGPIRTCLLRDKGLSFVHHLFCNRRFKQNFLSTLCSLAKNSLYFRPWIST